MSYGIDATTDFSIFGTGETDNPGQLDIMWFSDCHSATATSPFTLEGGSYNTITANGGSIGVNTIQILSTISHNDCSGILNLQTGTTSNSTGYAIVLTSIRILPGIPTPSNGFVTKYEYEVGVRPSATMHSNTVRGAYIFGFADTISNTLPTKGIYFEFLCDGTTTDTNWMVVIKSSSGTSRISTGVAVTAVNLYRLYLCVEVNSAGTYTTTYKIKNVTTSVSTEGTVSPTSDTHYPSSSTDYMGSIALNTKRTTATATSVALVLDYIGTRIRRPLSREILITP